MFRNLAPLFLLLFLCQSTLAQEVKNSSLVEALEESKNTFLSAINENKQQPQLQIKARETYEHKVGELIDQSLPQFRQLSKEEIHALVTAAFDIKAYEQGVQITKVFVERFPDNLEASRLAVFSLMNCNRYDEASELIRIQAARGGECARLNRLLGLLAMRYQQNGEHNKGMAELSKFLTLQNDNLVKNFHDACGCPMEPKDIGKFVNSIKIYLPPFLQGNTRADTEALLRTLIKQLESADFTRAECTDLQRQIEMENAIHWLAIEYASFLGNQEVALQCFEWIEFFEQQLQDPERSKYAKKLFPQVLSVLAGYSRFLEIEAIGQLKEMTGKEVLSLNAPESIDPFVRFTNQLQKWKPIRGTQPGLPKFTGSSSGSIVVIAPCELAMPTIETLSKANKIAFAKCHAYLAISDSPVTSETGEDEGHDQEQALNDLALKLQKAAPHWQLGVLRADHGLPVQEGDFPLVAIVDDKGELIEVVVMYSAYNAFDAWNALERFQRSRAEEAIVKE